MEVMKNYCGFRRERMTCFGGLLIVQLNKDKEVKCMHDKHLSLKNVKM